MPIPFFKCEKCKRTFDRFEDAEGCEAVHLPPAAVEVKSYSIRPFPYSVDITFLVERSVFITPKTSAGNIYP